MILSRAAILKAVGDGTIRIDQFDEAMLKTASYSFTLSEELTLEPGQFAKAMTKEKLTLSPGVACLLSTRRSIAEQGVDALQTDYYCEPDTDNTIVLFLKNHGPAAVTVPLGTPVVKGIFFEVK
jgi:deoxycytidine triphosphate deaminase